MAQVSSSFKCLICNESLKFPPDSGIVDFTIFFLQFYKEHDRCEIMKSALEKKSLEVKKETSKNNQGKKKK